MFFSSKRQEKMIEKMGMLILFGSGLGLVGLWIFREKVSFALYKPLIRSLVTPKTLSAQILMQNEL